MPSHVQRLLVKMVLSFVCATGVVGALVLGFLGIRAGAHGELERILAILCIAMVAGSYLGLRGDDGLADTEPSFLSFGDKVILVVSVPLIAGCTLVFVATLVPSWYVIVPVFAALWNAVFRRPRPAVSAPPPARGPVQHPAYG
jgi:hypothetical protein